MDCDPDDLSLSQEAIDAMAAAWTVRMGDGPLNSAERRDLNAWLIRDPRHRRAFEDAQTAWGHMDAFAETQRTTPRWARKSSLRWAPAMALAACLTLFVGGGLLWTGDPMVLITADHATAPGETRRIALADGSTVDLGAASAVAIEYSNETRRVRLLAGVAYFTAAPMTDTEPRPFAVTAEGGSARALGTQFMVTRLSNGAEVTVAEHDVAVSLDKTQDDSVILHPGQSVRYGLTGMGSVSQVNLSRATAWRRGQLVFDHRPLSEVVAALNRYRRGRIVIADAALAGRQVSGVFSTDDPAAALATITTNLKIGAANLPLVTVLY